MKTWAALCVAFLTGWPMAAPAQNTHTLPLVRPADFSGQESLVRIVNRSAMSGTVQVNAIDDTGERFGPVILRRVAEIFFPHGVVGGCNTALNSGWQPTARMMRE